jgi:negative regulator of flagellin synthesis FlgM
MQINGASQVKTHQVHGPQGLSGPHARRTASGGSTSSGGVQSTDQVEISPEAQEAARLAEAAETRAAERLQPADGQIRADLVARLRSEIAAGTYESGDKLDAALDRLIDEIG